MPAAQLRRIWRGTGTRASLLRSSRTSQAAETAEKQPYQEPSGSLAKAGCPHLARFSRDVGYHGALPLTLDSPMHLAVNIGGIPHLAKNQRDVGHPALVTE